MSELTLHQVMDKLDELLVPAFNRELFAGVNAAIAREAELRAEVERLSRKLELTAQVRDANLNRAEAAESKLREAEWRPIESAPPENQNILTVHKNGTQWIAARIESTMLANHSRQLWPLPATAASIGSTKTPIYRKTRAGTFPPPLKFGKSVRWISDEVEAYRDYLIANPRATDEQLKKFVADLVAKRPTLAEVA